MISFPVVLRNFSLLSEGDPGKSNTDRLYSSYPDCLSQLKTTAFFYQFNCLIIVKGFYFFYTF